MLWCQHSTVSYNNRFGRACSGASIRWSHISMVSGAALGSRHAPVPGFDGLIYCGGAREHPETHMRVEASSGALGA